MVSSTSTASKTLVVTLTPYISNLAPFYLTSIKDTSSTTLKEYYIANKYFSFPTKSMTGVTYQIYKVLADGSSTKIFDRTFLSTEVYANDFPVASCTYSSLVFACTLDIGTAIIPYYTQIAIGTAHSLVWKSYSLFKSVDCTVTSGSKPNLTSSDSFSTLWITTVTDAFGCSFTFSNSLITAATTA